jgi:hypothetical protein
MATIFAETWERPIGTLDKRGASFALQLTKLEKGYVLIFTSVDGANTDHVTSTNDVKKFESRYEALREFYYTFMAHGGMTYTQFRNNIKGLDEMYPIAAEEYYDNTVREFGA